MFGRWKFRLACIAMAFPLALIVGAIAGVIGAMVEEAFPRQGPHYGNMESVMLFAIVSLIGSAVLPFMLYRVGARWDTAANQASNEKYDWRSNVFPYVGLFVGVICLALFALFVLSNFGIYPIALPPRNPPSRSW